MSEKFPPIADFRVSITLCGSLSRETGLEKTLLIRAFPTNSCDSERGTDRGENFEKYELG